MENISIEHINFIVIGIFIASTLVQLYIFYFTDRNIIQILLILLSLVSAFYLFNTSNLHLSASIEEVRSLNKYNVGLYLIQMMIIIFLIYVFNNRHFKYFTYLLVTFIAALLFVNILLPAGLIYKQITDLNVVFSTSQAQYKNVIGIVNSFYTPLALIFYVALLSYFGISVYNLWKTQASRKAFILGVMSVIFLFVNVFDVLIDIGVIHFLYLTEYFTLPIIILIDFENAMEIKDKKKIELMLKKTEDNFQTLIENVQLIVVGLDHNAKINYANPYLSSLSQYNLSDIIGRNFIDIFIPSEIQSKISVVFSDIMDGKDHFHYENQIMTKNKEVKTIAWSYVKIMQADKNEESVLSIGVDITDRTHSREKLEQAYDELKQIKNRLEEENTYLKESFISDDDRNSSLIGKSDAMTYVKQNIKEVAKTQSNVLIEGETGVGKEMVAQAIYNNSHRNGKPFVIVNCGALPKTLIESELFGHEKGSYTGAEKRRIGRFELADGGTIFLDEIGELPLELQPKLLRVLQTGEFERLGSNDIVKVDVRILAATNRDLRKAASEGAFRTDLYYRLSVYPITIPPLRMRKEDIPELAELFIKEYCQKLDKKQLKLSIATVKDLQNYSWPGNIRELRNVIERSIIISDGNKLVLRDKLEEQSYEVNEEQISLVEHEKQKILKTLEAHNWKISGNNGAAAFLEINESTLRSKMKKLGINKNNGYIRN